MRRQYECAQDSKLVNLVIASIWFASGMTVWCISVTGYSFSERSGSTLTFATLMILLVTTAIRLPILCREKTASEDHDHAIYLLSLGGLVNWLGAIAANGKEIIEILPAVILATISEIWFLRKAWKHGNLTWLSKISGYSRAQSVVMLDDASLAESQNLNESNMLSETSFHHDDCNDPHGPCNENIIHRTVAGTDAVGQAYVSGESLAVFEAGQTSTAVIAAFSPPFSSQPEIETECEDDVDIQVIRCTPIGCRLEIKRRNKESSQKMIIGWYATSAAHTQTSDPIVLP